MEILEVLLEDDADEWDSSVSHMIAGSMAGIAEHCAAFPLDTIKVSNQSRESLKYLNFKLSARLIYKHIDPMVTSPL